MQNWPRVVVLAEHLEKLQVLSAFTTADTRASKSSSQGRAIAGPRKEGGGAQARERTKSRHCRPWDALPPESSVRFPISPGCQAPH